MSTEDSELFYLGNYIKFRQNTQVKYSADEKDELPIPQDTIERSIPLERYQILWFKKEIM